jgi:hypothetical protein
MLKRCHLISRRLGGHLIWIPWAQPDLQAYGEVLALRVKSETVIRLAVIGVIGIWPAVGLAVKPLISELVVGKCGKAPGMGLDRRRRWRWSHNATETSLYQLKDLTSRFLRASARKNRSRGAPKVATQGLQPFLELWTRLSFHCAA